MSLILQNIREKYNLPEQWQDKKWEKQGWDGKNYTHILFQGGVYPHVVASGEREGLPNFKRPLVGSECSVSIAFSEHEEWIRKWEKRTGSCRSCEGSGQRWNGYNCETGTRYKPCTHCNATGKVCEGLK